jgi:AsmA family
MAANAQDRAVTLRLQFLRSRRGMMAVVALVLVLFLFRPGVYRLRNRIAISIGNALGRRVAIDNVRLRLLPRPGFDLEGLVIYDDLEFSAEPMIRAQDVSAAIRFRSLLRGRLEIATLSATEPSINLVRNDRGRWNLASLLERNAQIPAAPTEKRAFERRPAFPYLEAGHARINFKIGQTKKSYALMDADVALWQDTENSWSGRIKGAPVRTDFNLTDTGILLIDAKWQRASSLRLTPLQLTVQWQNGQLGQITQLLSGKDRGWRGGVSVKARLAGTPEALMIESQLSADSFHRYDIVGSENVRLASVCSGQYNSVTAAVSDLLCQSPVSSGNIRLIGTAALVAQVPTYDLKVAAENVPLAPVIVLLRQAKKQIPIGLTASGLLSAEFHATRTVSGGAQHDALPHVLQTWNGTGAATNVRLSSSAIKSATNVTSAAKAERDDITFATIQLALIGPKAGGPTGGLKASGQTRRKGQQSEGQKNDEEPTETSLRIGPATLAVSSSAPLSAGGSISRGGYHFFLRGDTELKDLFRLENVLGLPGPRPAAQGLAKLDVNVSGQWQGFPAPVTFGTAQLRNVRAEIRGLNTPIEIASANIILGPDALLMQKISAHTEGTVTGTKWSGAVTVPLHCAARTTTPSSAARANLNGPGNCGYQFDLVADELSAANLTEWLIPHAVDRPWYRILNSRSNTTSSDQLSYSPLLALEARGNLHVGRLLLKKVVANEVFSQVEVDRGKITLTALRGQLLQGTHRGNWVIDVNHAPGVQDESNQSVSTTRVSFHGIGTLRNISLDHVSALMNDGWISGTADGNFVLEGSNFRDLLAHSNGKLQFSMRNGSLSHVEIPGSPGPLSVRQFTGELNLKEGAWRLSSGKLESDDGDYQVNGTASASGTFDFLLTSEDEPAWTITGTLAEPHVAPVGQVEAKRAGIDKAAKP